MLRTFIATTGSSLARATRDANGQWTVDFLLADQDVRCLAADPANADVVYAGTQGSGVLRSADRGQTWGAAGLDGHIIKSLAVSKVQPGTVYAGTKPPMIFVSQDEGQTWAELEPFREMRRWYWFTPAEWPFTQPYVLGLAASPTDPNTIVAGIEAGAVLRSTDGGQTWRGHLKGAIRDCHTLMFHPINGDWVYEGGGSGAAHSQDAGRTWIQSDPQSIGGVLRHIFGGAESSDGSGLDRHYGWAVGADPERPDIWYCSVSTGPAKAHGDEGDARACIYRCMDGGNWQRLTGGLPQPLPYMPYALIADAEAPGHLYAGLSNGDIWHTTDYGDTWAQLPLNLKGIHRSLIGLH